MAVMFHYMPKITGIAPAQVIPREGRQFAGFALTDQQALAHRAVRKAVEALGDAPCPIGEFRHGHRPVGQRGEHVQMHGGVDGAAFPVHPGSVEQGGKGSSLS